MTVYADFPTIPGSGADRSQRHWMKFLSFVFDQHVPGTRVPPGARPAAKQLTLIKTWDGFKLAQLYDLIIERLSIRWIKDGRLIWTIELTDARIISYWVARFAGRAKGADEQTECYIVDFRLMNLRYWPTTESQAVTWTPGKR